VVPQLQGVPVNQFGGRSGPNQVVPGTLVGQAGRKLTTG
jgi:hypothetical protein